MEKINNSLNNPKAPYLIQCVVYIFVGTIGLIFWEGYIKTSVLSYNIFIFIWIATFSAIFAYGVICLMLDIKRGGIAYVIKKIKNFKNGGI